MATSLAQAQLRASASRQYTQDNDDLALKAILWISRADIKDEMNEVDGITMLEGGLKIESGGSLLGAVGVSGAPGGDKDAACAQAALDKLADRLELMD